MKCIRSIIYGLLCIALPFQNSFAQLMPPDGFFPKQKTPVLVVGTFHFDYPGLDAHKTADNDKIDVLKEPKKTEITELVNYIKQFKPTKIAIEAFPGWHATEKLRQYKSGEFRNKRDERFQLGMRLAAEMNLDTLYSIDQEAMEEDLSRMDANYTKRLFKDFDFQSNDPYETMFKQWYSYEDKLPARMNLLAYFKRINSRNAHQLGYGAYLVGDFKLADNRGADILSVWWYNRNLRIFRQLQRITEPGRDRILVIFGNGHACILRQLLECSPEYQFVSFDSL